MALEYKSGIDNSADLAREVYMKGIDYSYCYEGYTTFKAEEL